MQLSNKKLFDLIGLTLITLLTPLAIWGLMWIRDYRSKSNLEGPKNIEITNLTTESFTITWTTPQKELTGYIKYSKENSTANILNYDIRDKEGLPTARRTHYVEVKNLEADTTYNITIFSGDKSFKDIAKAKTINITTQSTNRLPIYGDTSGITDDDAIVLIKPKNKDVYPASTYLKADGSWYKDIGQFIEKSSLSLIEVTGTDPLEIRIDSGEKGVLIEGTSKNSPISAALEPNYPKLSLLNTNSTPTITINPTPTNSPHPDMTLTPTETASPTQTPSSPAPTSTSDRLKPTPTPLMANGYKFVPPESIRQDLMPILMGSGPIDNNSANTLLKEYYEPFHSNITENSITISVLTESKVETSFKYGTSATDLVNIRKDDKDSGTPKARYIHNVTLRNLIPGETYYYSINNKTGTFNLPSTISQPPTFKNVSGKISTSSTPECIVLTKTKDDLSHLATSIANSSYLWNINLGALRTSNLTNYTDIDNSDIIKYKAICVNSSGDATSGETEATLERSLNTQIVIKL